MRENSSCIALCICKRSTWNLDCENWCRRTTIEISIGCVCAFVLTSEYGNINGTGRKFAYPWTALCVIIEHILVVIVIQFWICNVYSHYRAILFVIKYRFTYVMRISVLLGGRGNVLALLFVSWRHVGPVPRSIVARTDVARTVVVHLTVRMPHTRQRKRLKVLKRLSSAE